MARTPKQKLEKGYRRLNVNLPPDVYEDLQQLSQATNRTMTEIVRAGLALAHVALHATSKQRKLAITDIDGTPIKELILIRLRLPFRVVTPSGRV